MIGTVIKNEYKIYDEVGSGGIATVYVARDLKTNEMVAVKVIHPHIAKDLNTVKRFEREANLLMSLTDPHLVRVYDYGIEEDRHYLVMEYIGGRTLKAIIKEEGPLAVDRAMDIAQQVAEGLSVIHQQGVVHRDIKPQNLMVQTDGTVKVMDFGIARMADLSALTQSGFLVGTPHYISPEQAMGQRVDHRSDIYSLGVVLYEMLMGKVLFDGDSPVTVALMHVKDPVPSLRLQRTDIPPQVEQLVDKCLDKEPGDRFQTAAVLANAIGSLRGEPKAAVPQPAREAEPLATLYKEGMAHLIAERWQEASQRFESVVAQDPGYRDAAARLSEAREGWHRASLAEGPRPAAPPAERRGGVGLMAMALMVGALCLISLALVGGYVLWNQWAAPTPIPPVIVYASSTPSPTFPPELTFTPTPPPITPPEVATPTFTLTPTLTPEPTDTPTATPTWTPTHTPTPTPWPMCTPPSCNPGEVYYCPGECPGGCGVQCATPTPLPNHPPVMQRVYADVGSVEENKTVAVHCEASDPDGDFLQYSWTATGGQISGSGPSATYVASAPPGSYTINVAVTDGRGGSASDSITLHVVAAGPPNGLYEPEGKFGKVWHENATVREKLGWAVEEEQSPPMAQEAFERGFMFWREDTRQIHVLHSEGTWQVFADTWTPDQPLYSCPDVAPSESPPTPLSGFGKVWCERLGGPSAAIGWAKAAEEGYTGAAMEFERGLMLWSKDRIIYVLFGDGTWREFADTYY
jgi:serine/threonine-protein kinase